MGLGEGDHKGKVCFQHIKSRAHAIINRIIIEDANFGHLFELVFVWFFHCKVTFLPLHTLLFGRKLLCITHP